MISHREPTFNRGKHEGDSEPSAKSKPSLATRQAKRNFGKRGRQLLSALCDNGDYHQLQRYAAGRLARLGLNSEAAADILHEAVQAVLIGLGGGRNGRHARPKDLHDLPSFLMFMKRTIKSIATSAGRHHRCVPFVPLTNGENPEEEIAETLAIGPGPDREAEFSDLSHELFHRLRKRAPKQVRRMAKAWERDAAWSDSIPLRGAHRQYRAQLRELAQEILSEIEPALQPATRRTHAIHDSSRVPAACAFGSQSKKETSH